MPKNRRLGPLNPPQCWAGSQLDYLIYLTPNPAQMQINKKKRVELSAFRPVTIQTKKEGRFEKPGNSEEHRNLTGTRELNRNSTGNSEFHHRSEEQGHHRSGRPKDQLEAQNLIILRWKRLGLYQISPLNFDLVLKV